MQPPALSRSTLRITAGLIWTAVGVVLISMAVYWLIVTPGNWVLPLVVGLVVGSVVYYFGFLRLVRKNKARIVAQAEGKDEVCAFAFQSWKSYIIIVVMILLGYFLRHLPISRLYLAPIYLTIGLGLFLSSLHYYPEGS